MKNVLGIIAITATLIGCGGIADAQQPAKVWRIGVLVSSSPSLNVSRDAALRDGLRKFGYVESQNIIMEFRYAEGKLDRLAELAAELVRLKVDVIVVGGTRVALAAKQATSTIPIVLAGAGDPVPTGLVASYMRPGGNVTGVSRLSPDFIGNRVGLVKEAVPTAARLAVLSTPENPGHGPSLKEAELGASAWGMRVQSVAVRTPSALGSAFRDASKGRADALFVLPDALFHSHLSRLVELAAEHRLPTMYDRADFVEAGGLMSYAVNVNDLARRAAWYIDQIFQGAKPAELPMTEPTKYELVINLKAAKQIGLTIPPNMLARADRVIK